jgi:hypothetical protein
MVEVPGLPKGVPIIDPTIKQMVELGRWDLKAEPLQYKYVQPGTQFRVFIRPRLVPGVEYFGTGFEGHSRQTAVDTRLATLEDRDNIVSPALRHESGYVEKIPAERDGNLYRGVSWEEFQFIKEQCKIESNCSYNLGECEIGRTYFSEDPDMAAHYGGTFQPYHMQPSFDRPGYVIKIRKQPPERIDLKVSREDETAVIGSVPVSEIIAIYEIRPYAISPGDVELRLNDRGGHGAGFYEGSRMGPSVRVAYRKLEDMGDICSRMERTRMVEEQRAFEVKAEEPERYKIVGKRIPAEMREAIRELGKDMPIDFVEVGGQEEGAPELTIETRCGATKLDGLADKAKLSESLSQVSCKVLEQKKEVPS